MPVAEIARQVSPSLSATAPPVGFADLARRSPMFAPLAEIIASLPVDRWPRLDTLTALAASSALHVQSGAPLSFVPPDANSERCYEARIFSRGQVPTRGENWHDLFNALVWLTFPKTKAALNRRHFLELRSGTAQNRGRVRDALTLFDESGVVIVCANAELAELVREFRWRELFWTRRAETIAQTQCFLFGHALYEKALAPYVGMTGHGVILDVDAEFARTAIGCRLAVIDAMLSAYFERTELGRRAFAPLPLLGIPGWADENTSESYYHNRAYFRAGRRPVQVDTSAFVDKPGGCP